MFLTWVVQKKPTTRREGVTEIPNQSWTGAMDTEKPNDGRKEWAGTNNTCTATISRIGSQAIVFNKVKVGRHLDVTLNREKMWY